MLRAGKGVLDSADDAAGAKRVREIIEHERVLARQLMQQYVQKSSTTIRPLSSRLSDSGGAFIQVSPVAKSGTTVPPPLRSCRPRLPPADENITQESSAGRSGIGR